MHLFIGDFGRRRGSRARRCLSFECRDSWQRLLRNPGSITTCAGLCCRLPEHGSRRESANDELESGKRGAKVAGDNADPYPLAQYLAIRDSFADQWKPQGGIESAMVEMLAVAYSLQMYWSTVAHDRAIRTHDAQSKALSRFEAGGWKSPYQSEADAVAQAHRLADGHNRQFLCVLRQLRDLRRYAPVVIQNAQQVNVGAEQLNISS